MAYFNDYTLMRALVMDYAQDTCVNKVSDQFKFGPALMVCPVYQYGARKRSVYFPAGTDWYDFYNGKQIKGGQRITVDAPYVHIPLFVPAGTILPMGPDMQYCDQVQPDTLTIYIYQGRDGQFTLYEDEEDNYNYERVMYATIPFLYDEVKKTLTIGWRKGNYPGMLLRRTFCIVVVNANKPYGVDTNEVNKVVTYNGRKMKVKL